MDIPAQPQNLAAKASGSSFYMAMRLLPKPERKAMFAIYAFSRMVDDIADEDGPTRAERQAGLAAWRADIESLYAGAPSPRAQFLVPAVNAYGLRKADFLALIDGMAMDVTRDIRAPDLEELDLYCDRVASAVGRLSIKVFGMEEEPGFQLAHHLGRALQLTNILRDLDEDAGNGRLYLPREFLVAAGIETFGPGAAIATPKVDAACREVALLAHRHYRDAEKILNARPKGMLRAPSLMRAVYSRILAATEKAGWAPPRTRAKLGKTTLVLILIRHGLFG